MKLVPLSRVEPAPRRLAIGTFDGVHLGHRKVIEGADTVVTFDPHPVAVVHPEAAPRLLTPLPLKARLLAELGVSETVVIEFDDRFHLVTAEQFIDDVLIARLGATHVSIGENFRFGFQARGTPEMLAARPEFETRIVPLVETDSEVVSSSQIRGLVGAGEVARARDLLGYPFTLGGEVVTGDKRGRELGFPTANIVPGDELVTPGHGVYAAFTDGMPSAVNVGVRPTFETGRGLLVESYVIDWSGDLYGREISVEFIERMRGERRYDSIAALTAQMHLDVELARAIIARVPVA